jgi:hypothetical protein
MQNRYLLFFLAPLLICIAGFFPAGDKEKILLELKKINENMLAANCLSVSYSIYIAGRNAENNEVDTVVCIRSGNNLYWKADDEEGIVAEKSAVWVKHETKVIYLYEKPIPFVLPGMEFQQISNSNFDAFNLQTFSLDSVGNTAVLLVAGLKNETVSIRYNKQQNRYISYSITGIVNGEPYSVKIDFLSFEYPNSVDSKHFDISRFVEFNQGKPITGPAYEAYQLIIQ